jgi:hypothetical protein
MACLRSLLLLSSLLAPAGAAAQFAGYDLRLTACADATALGRAGFEARDVERDAGGPSGGHDAGPVGPSDVLVAVPESGELRSVRLHVPASYDPAQPAPLVLVLHGASGSSATAPAAADAMRTLWTVLAEREGAIIVAPVAGGAQGGWVPTRDTPMIACALALVASRYAVDLDRRFLWGFSAGAHYGHALALGNAGRFAAYAVNAGALHALACTPAGSPNQCETLLPQALRPIPVSLRVGSNDGLRGYVLGDQGRLLAAGWEMPAQLQYAEFVGGHTVAVPDVEAAWAWFRDHPRRP